MFHTTGEIKTGNALIQFNLRSFDQNIISQFRV